MAKKYKVFDSIYTAIEERSSTVGTSAHTIVYSNRGEPSVFIELCNTVQQYSADETKYYNFISVYDNIVSSLGEGYTLQKQDIFSRQKYHHEITDDMEYLTKSYFNFFNGREYVEIRTFLIITQEAVKSKFIKYDKNKEKEFFSKIEKVLNILSDKNIPYHKLNRTEIEDYIYRFLAFDYQQGAYSISNIKSSPEKLDFGARDVKSYSLINIDEVDLPNYIQPYTTISVNGISIETDLFSFLSAVPYTDTMVYNQVIKIPEQRKLLRSLQAKAKRHASMPDGSNKIAATDINTVLDIIANERKLLVYTNYNLIVSSPKAKTNKVKSWLETKFYDAGIVLSQSTFNQLELFQASFPGNAYAFKDYDLFLTLTDAAFCFLYKEYVKCSEETPLKTYYTDRNGLPVCIDITGKEGAIRFTDNSNFFCIGPSGSGKSFHMNSVVRQLIEQNTEVIMVDTGDSYEGICRYFSGTYITYSKERPISMNPFKITDLEYQENFGEKKQFLCSLIFLIFKGQEFPTKIEETIINKTIVEYYELYFNPFTKYTPEERKELTQKLLLADKKDGIYDKEQAELEEKLEEKLYEREEEVDFHKKRSKAERQIDKLHQLISDEAATSGEKENANAIIHSLMPKVLENHYLVKIEERIDRMEQQRQRLKVKELSFNSYYEFALERIPQIMAEQNVSFDINNFAAILEKFYRGGELEYTLNSDVDSSLFNEKFIVFEIDKIKDDPVLFPIVVLIIMDVFIQKMRLKKGRKALIIEEAWKAISSPTMAEYIKYLYKTVRKFHGIAGVVTQELNDVIDSPIVKEAIINNSDIKILLDQSKFRERYDDIAAVMGLTPIQRKQIFTVNALENKENRNFFREVWICRGQYSDVYGVEEPPECYWAYTTERAEKEALKIYEAYYGDIQTAIENIEKDRKKLQIKKYLDFARQINNHQKVYALWENI